MQEYTRSGSSGALTRVPESSAIGVAYDDGADVEREAGPRVWLQRLRGRPGLLLGVLLSTLLFAAYVARISAGGRAMQVLTVLIPVGMLACAVAAPERLAVVAVAYLPYARFYPLSFGSVAGLNATNVLLLSALVTWAIARLRGHRSSLGLFDLVLAAYAFTGMLGALRAFDLTSGSSIGGMLFDYRTWVGPLLFYFLGVGALHGREDVKDVVSMLAWNVVLVGLATWYDGMNNQRSSIEESRVYGVLGQPNSMAAFLVYYGVPLLAYAVLAKGWAERLPLWCGFLVCARALLYTFSRGGYLALAAGASVVFLFSSPLYLLGAGGGIVAVQAFPQLFPDSVTQRFGSTVSEGEIYDASLESQLDASNQGRLVLWGAALNMIEQHPIRGVGLGRFSMVVDDYAEMPLPASHPRDAHNAYLLTAAEQGLPSVVLMVVIIAWLTAGALSLRWRGEDPFDRAVGLAFLGVNGGVVVSCLFGSRFSDESLIGCYWILAGAVRVLRAIRREESATLPA